jgi:hypothetical protein
MLTADARRSGTRAASACSLNAQACDTSFCGELIGQAAAKRRDHKVLAMRAHQPASNAGCLI